MKLSDFPDKPYSMLEFKMFGVMPKNGRRITSEQLVDARVKMGPWKVDYPLNVITVTMGRLIEKVKANREPFRVLKENKYNSVEYWVEPR